MKTFSLYIVTILIVSSSMSNSNNRSLTPEKRQELIEKYSQLITTQPNFVNYGSLARLYYQAGRMQDAELNYAYAASFQRDFNILHEYANTLSINNKHAQAIPIYEYLTKVFPTNFKIKHNLACALKESGHIDQALAIYDQVLVTVPNNAEVHVARALGNFKKGNLLEGWTEYEWRWKQAGMQPRVFDKPEWDGGPLHGKRILLHAEQGLGDTFQFIRYAKIAKEQGGYVIAMIQEPLFDIMLLCPYIDEVVGLYTHTSLPEFDCHAALMTVPAIVKTTLDTIPYPDQYLQAKPELVTYWKEKLAANTNFKIGVCWQGNAFYKDTLLQVTVMHKSIHPQMLQAMCDIPNVSVYSLQKVTGVAHPEQIPSSITIFDEEFDKAHGRFMDTAAVMCNLDLIITIDTSTAHLSAALGVPTWVLLPEPADWRWLNERTDTPWYSTMTLFRQQTPGQWQPVLDRIVHELQLLIERSHN